ncbi:nuclear transport factor 2 family protein [Sphingomonas profundi]|uniref:nuclear transport factor 2 family protein n=1 Tax=Alterirhizorhabdus profundi TaxID=2681549 RepID=UPI0018D03FAD|nr:nuclear transport factor 2 family protein [Sphingomonas profundi]
MKPRDLAYLLDRNALEERLIAYCTAVDSLSDMDGLLDCFTEDAVFDLGGIGLPRFEGREAMRGFFTQVFADMTHHGHACTNFVVDRLEENEATCRAFIIGLGASHDGTQIQVYVRYFLDYVRTEDGWKIASFAESTIMPLPPEVTAVHARD